ncbi:ATP-dependent nuclease [Chitinophaga pinensis]|uniref:ATP-dependent endonuclease of the OLD family-like protein n=1 Tax=Chitinophaga pinensis (strain ATCC 43595 / DSM 2588 / LMG 13176 / NBRC 15968 / NCIMB 11800 / UQM 2034) TaxID=485918 RepID=A0A979GX61_CHIPD|nr:AAA family ATPase [Chitinophaga pinensis]ACU60965.1 ATP-dependent endonuclease of the OLD family-like protein [Chitinophaga pinensis DSM 2588]
MILEEISIQNFRSIKDETITFPHNCLILLGKNEAGKTNVLKAIAALFNLYKVSGKDKRKRLGNEVLTDFFVRAVFKLTEEDFTKVEESFFQTYSGIENIVFVKEISIRDYIKAMFYNLLINVNIRDNASPQFSYWTNSSEYVKLKHPLFINGNNISFDIGSEFNLSRSIFEIVKGLYNENPINCHYWQYNDSYLLPSAVNIDNFISNPSTCKALENIFALCGRENIKKEFETAMSEDGDYLNLLEQLSQKVSTTFQKIWKDFKNTSIQILPNGDEMLIKVVEKAKYNFEDRSDGFKKFISILLMLSTQSRANKMLDNDIILIDEPDQSLYPTSAQYLKNELIEISKKSKIIYSTHSQYMIDSEVIGRHIIVEKNDDITSLKKNISNAPFASDELLRRAVGVSIFECLKAKNIVFEGYLDKALFSFYCKSFNLEKVFSTYGQVYLNGIAGAETLVQILNLADKKFVIVADSDETSNNKRADFTKNYPDFQNRWLAYADICKKVSTMEDFLTSSHIENQFKKHGYIYTYDSSKNANYNIEKAVNKDKELKQKFKKILIDTAKKSDIETEYKLYLDALKEALEVI